MADIVNTGAAANDGSGDQLRTAFQQINQRFQQLLGTLSNRGAWTAGTDYVADPARDWVLHSGQAYVAAVNHTSGMSFSADLAAGLWLAVDVSDLIALLASLGGASHIGTDDGRTVQQRLSGLPQELAGALEIAADRAEAARDAAQLAAGVYPDTATGLAATTSGDYFSVPSAESSESLILYLNSSGTALEVKRYPAVVAVDAIAADLKETSYAAGYVSPLPIPAGAAAITSGLFVLADPVADSGTVSRVSLHSAASGTVTIIAVSKVGDVFTTLRSVAFSVAAGYQQISVAMPVNAGEYLGFSGAGTVTYGSLLADGTGFYSGASSPFTDASKANNIRMGIRFDVTRQTRLESMDAAIAARADAARVSALEDVVFPATRVQIIGQSGAIPAGSGSLSGATLWALEDPVAQDGTLSQFSCYAASPGAARVMVYGRVGDTFTVKREATVALAGGYQAVAVSLPVEAGDYVGFQSGVIQQQGSVSDPLGWFGAQGYNSFTDSTVTRNVRLLVGFVVSYRVASSVLGRPVSVDLPFENMLIIGAGQSLMEGSQTGSSGTVPITTAQEYDSVGFPAYPAAPSAILPATVANTQRPTNRGEWPGLGAAAAVRVALLRDNNISHTGLKSTVVVANNAVGGASIASLSQGTAPYLAAVAQAGALAGLTSQTAGVLGVIFGQGESDSATTRADYRAAMIELAKDYDADLRAATGQAKRVPLVAYQLSTQSRDIALAQLDASLQSDLVYLACPMYQFDYYDSLHIDSVSSRRLGAYYGEALKAVAIDGDEWEPLRPVSSQVVGNTIVLTFNKSGLVLDTTLVPAQTNQGFFVRTGAMAAVTINSVAVVNGNQLRIACATTPASDWVVQYGVTATGKAPYSGRAGNLRDSAGDALSFDGFPLHNWCVLFDWVL